MPVRGCVGVAAELVGDAPSAADFVLYPDIAYVKRIGARKPESKLAGILPHGFDHLPCALGYGDLGQQPELPQDGAQGRAQFVAGVCQQVAVGLQQLAHAVGGLVEAGG